MSSTWHEIWERKGGAAVDGYDLETLIALDGYDGGAAQLGSEQFRAIPDYAAKKLDLRPGQLLLEVGCGAGALLWCLRDSGLRLFGVDFSAALISHARAAIPEATFAVAEACDLPFEADAIVCAGVFHYFPDYDYAHRVLDGFRRAAPVALIMDVPDLATREEAERERRALGSKPGVHLYYPRSFFSGAEVETCAVEGYGNAPFRFNAMFDFRREQPRTA